MAAWLSKQCRECGRACEDEEQKACAACFCPFADSTSEGGTDCTVGGAWTVDMGAQMAHRRGVSFGVGDSIIVSASLDQSPAGQWLGYVIKLTQDTVRMRFFYAHLFSTAEELGAYTKAAGQILRDGEVVLSVRLSLASLALSRRQASRCPCALGRACDSQRCHVRDRIGPKRSTSLRS
eukprot:COSAG01_NODE_19619_length_1000_cov_0.904550_1_plen_179_part_00